MQPMRTQEPSDETIDRIADIEVQRLGDEKEFGAPAARATALSSLQELLQRRVAEMQRNGTSPEHAADIAVDIAAVIEKIGRLGGSARMTGPAQPASAGGPAPQARRSPTMRYPARSRGRRTAAQEIDL